MKDLSEGDVDSEGVNVHYYRTGSGDKPALILAHGLTDNGLCWTRLAKELEERFDIVMVDARNHGGSGVAKAGRKELAGDMAQVITELGLDQPAAIGHSVGAGVVASLAADHPHLVSRIVLEDPPWFSGQAVDDEAKTRKRRAAFREHMEQMAAMTLTQISDFGKELSPTWADEEFPAWAASKKQVSPEAMDNLDLGHWMETVPRVQCPALLVYADAECGGIVNQDLVSLVQAENSRIKSHQIADAGHNIRREQFGEYVDVIKRFLDE
jgi:pimeloyl-ACP methyl ester carboxylesterase